jgi:hypothetical protein
VRSHIYTVCAGLSVRPVGYEPIRTLPVMYPSSVSRISTISPSTPKDQPANASTQFNPPPAHPTLHSRHDSMIDAHLQTDRAHPTTELRQTSGSEGVLGLPSNIDPCLLDEMDLTHFNLNDDCRDDIFDFDAFGWTIDNGLDVPMEETPSDGLDTSALLFPGYTHDNQAGLGFGFAPVKDGHHDQTNQLITQNEAGQVSTHPVDVAPHGNQPIDPALDFMRDLDLWDPAFQMPSQFLDTTPGFSALPGGNAFMPDVSQYPAVGQHQQMYPDPYSSMYPVQPYFHPIQQQYPQQYTGYVAMPTEQHTATHQLENAFPPSSRRIIHDTRQVMKRKRASSDFDSDDDASIIKQPPGQPNTRIRSSQDSRHDSNVSNASSVSKPVKVAVVRAGEKPKKCDDKPWVRVNNTTRGETTRTARINQHAEEGRKYKTKPLPHGDWATANYKFEYSQNNGMHEFKKRTMSARHIHEYITQYPGDNLRIWIQPVASDSARRYASASHSHCRFEKCPMRVYTGKGTAEVGNYRVAFDEKHRTYGTGVVDPYDCVGYAHLYCMERFLDFAYICQVANVKVDQRVGMEKEPKGHFASAFGSKHHYEAALASKFIDAASQGRLADTHEFPDYPVHDDYVRGEPKPHERTLIYALYGMNMKHRAKSQMKQFILQRKIRPGSFPVHRGDMEVKLVDKKIEKLEAFADFKRDGSKKDFDYAAYYDMFHPEIKQRIAECEARRDEFIAEDEAGTGGKRTKTRRAITFADPDSDDERQNPSRKRSKKRQASDSDSSDDETPTPKRTRRATAVDDSDSSDSFERMLNTTKPRQTRLGSRAGLRKKQRINYSDPSDPLVPPRPAIHAQPIDFLPGYAPAIPFDARKHSLSAFFPANNDPSWTNIDFDAFPIDDDDVYMDEAAVDAIINAKYRRKSSTLSNGPCMQGMGLPELEREMRTAGFNPQPVSCRKEFQCEDPPSRVGDVGEGLSEKGEEQGGQMRRSKRLASRATPPASVAG